MKKIIAFSGSIGLSTAVIGTFLKIQHLTGGGVLLLTSIIAIALIFSPCYFKYWYDKNK